MIEIADNPHLGRYAGFPNDYLFDLIRRGSPFPDQYVQREIDRYVKPDSVCLDVGANLGYVSVYLSKRAKRVYSVEPQPVVFLQLCCNLFLNGCMNAIPILAAATEHPARLGFSDYQSGWVGTTDFSRYDKIRSIGSISLKESPDGPMIGERLDRLVQERVDFIKIDAQGGDVDAILGCTGIVEESRPVIVFEYEEDLSRNNYGRSITDLDDFLSRYRYAIRPIFEQNFILEPLP